MGDLMLRLGGRLVWRFAFLFPVEFPFDIMAVSMGIVSGSAH